MPAPKRLTNSALPVFLLGVILLLWLMQPSPLLAEAPDLTGKRVDVNLYNPPDHENGSLVSTMQLAFDAGKPGAPVKATILNPSQTELEVCSCKRDGYNVTCPDVAEQTAFLDGTYSTKGRLDLWLCRSGGRRTWFGFALDVDSNYRMSGVEVPVPGTAGAMWSPGGGRLTAKCIDCPAGSNWSATTIKVVVAVFLIWVGLRAMSRFAKKPQPVARRDDPSDPWHDLPKTSLPKRK